MDAITSRVFFNKSSDVIPTLESTSHEDDEESLTDLELIDRQLFNISRIEPKTKEEAQEAIGDLDTIGDKIFECLRNHRDPLDLTTMAHIQIQLTQWSALYEKFSDKVFLDETKTYAHRSIGHYLKNCNAVSL